MDFVSKNLDQTARPAGNVEMSSVARHIKGQIQKARINSQDALAAALDTAFRELNARAQQPDDLDSEIKMTRLPNYLQLLTFLAMPPTDATLRVAEEYMENIKNPPKPPLGLTWKDILAEEPFEGQHWEGAYNLPPGSTVEDWDTHSGGSTPSLSPWDDSDDPDESLSSSDSLAPTAEPDQLDAAQKSISSSHPRMAFGHRQDVEQLQARQYWRPGWRPDIPISQRFDIGDASTLGPSLQRILGQKTTLTIAGPEEEIYIYEHDAVREVLTGLQGRKNVMMKWEYTGNEAFSFVPNTSMRLLHLTAGAQLSIITSFTQSATTLEHLRKFVSAVYKKASETPTHTHTEPVYLNSVSRRNPLTLEACAAAVDSQLQEFDAWCASREEQICLAQAGVRPPLVVSLLSLDKAIKDEFSASFSVIFDVLKEVVRRALRNSEPLKEIWTYPELPMRILPSAFTTLLLDSLLVAVQERNSMGDSVTSDVLMRVFTQTAEPIWEMVGRWMKNGMPVQEMGLYESRPPATKLDDEFFVEDNELPLLDPDFWADGFVLKNSQEDESRTSSVPAVLALFAQDILDAGKAIGMLRALGTSATFERGTEQQWLASWRPFTSLIESPPVFSDKYLSSKVDPATLPGQARRVAATNDDLAGLIRDELLPHCRLAQEMLQRVIIDECDLWLHLSAMEDLFLMRQGDALSRFVDVLFARMDNKQAWSDFHFLNRAFRDVVEASSHKWINASLVRFSHRGSKDKSITRTVRAIDGLLLEYAVPFPLAYIFGPRVMQAYSSIFSFILQIRRAKSVLERILVRGAVANMSHVGSELKVFYALRSKLSWFVNTLLDFVATNVLHSQLLSFHEAFRQAKSLNDMIHLHDDHLTKIQSRCLLQQNTSPFQRAIISILDMALHFSDYFVAFAGDTTHDISRQSIATMKRHRSRRARRQRKNVIGFSQTLKEADVSSESSDSEFDDDLAEGRVPPEPSFSLAMSTVSAPDESFVDRLDKMSSELDTHVRFIRRWAESLAAGSGEAAPTFGMFAFALDDWDR